MVLKMILKKIDVKKVFFVLALIICMDVAPISMALEGDGNFFTNTREPVSEFSRGKIFTNGIMCVEKFKCFREEALQNGAKTDYKRIIEMSKIYKKKLKGNEFKILVTCNARIVATYDKENFVQIKKYSYDVKHNTSSKKWSLMNIGEVCPQEKNCLLSTKCVLYKENSMGAHEYIMDGHFDILCSIDGDIGINTDLQ